MKNNKTVTEVIKVAVILFVITAVAAAILASVNKVTAPVIKENNIKLENDAMLKVLPDAKEFTRVEFEKSEDSIVSEIYKSDAGYYAVKVSPNGYGGPISMIVGVDNDLKVTGVEIISQNETAGLGAKCMEKDFQNQFRGKTENIVVSKTGAKDNEIDAISSATITSKAVTKGVNEAIEAVKMIKGAE